MTVGVVDCPGLHAILTKYKNHAPTQVRVLILAVRLVSVTAVHVLQEEKLVYARSVVEPSRVIASGERGCVSAP